MPKMSLAPAANSLQMASSCDDVIELPGDATDISGILSAILRRPEFGVIECPLEVPACATGRLAVTRDRGLALVAAASRGLSELRTIGRAFQWMLENRALIVGWRRRQSTAALAMCPGSHARRPCRRPH